MQKNAKIIRIITSLLDYCQIKQHIASRIRDVLSKNPDKFNFGEIVARIPDRIASEIVIPIISDLLGPAHITEDLPCLKKCYPGTCFTSLLKDDHEKGVCNLNRKDKMTGDTIKITDECKVVCREGFILGTKNPVNIPVIKEATCSKRNRELTDERRLF